MLEVLSFINKLYRHKQPHAHIQYSKDHYFGGGERFESIRRNWIYGSRSVCFCFYEEQCVPQPLSSDDERKYLELMEQGDAQARNLLIEHNLRLVAHIVKKFENTGKMQKI